MGQTDEERIIEESLAELKEEAERSFKSRVKSALLDITAKQSAVTHAMLNLAAARKFLKDMKLEITMPIP